jgi:hypothetical protein
MAMHLFAVTVSAAPPETVAMLVRKMGYQLAIREVRHPAIVTKGAKLAFSLVGEN